MIDRVKTVLATAIVTLTVLSVPTTAGAAACMPAARVEVILDDSAQTTEADPDAVRVDGLKLLRTKPGNLGRYTALAGDPTVDARVFVTGGGDRASSYADAHQNGPPIYIVGVRTSPAGAGDAIADRLQSAAALTGGRYFSRVQPVDLVARMNAIDAALVCRPIARTMPATFTRTAQIKSVELPVPRGTRSAIITVSWRSPADAISLSGIGFAGAAPTTRRSAGRTFSSTQISGSKSGKLRFKLKLKRLTSVMYGSVKVTTQVELHPAK